MAFKELYARNAPLSQALPSLAADYPNAYAGWGLRDLCDALHAFNQEFSVAKVMREMYVDLPTPVMPPADAYNHLWPRRRHHAGAVPAGHSDHHAGRTLRRQR
ncbi:hypothetical protein G6F32_016896 [Rhizopus arrhizus]|nr:hypothetical protein G6F32_016896 [Rhizopus arrhizus]